MNHKNIWQLFIPLYTFVMHQPLSAMLKKILLALVSLLLVLALGFALFVWSSWDKTYDIKGPNLQVSTDSAVIAKGKYLVHGPAHCSTCHVATYQDMIKSDEGEAVALQGGVSFPMGPLGTLSPPNLTPDPTTGLGRYTDEQVFRMMRHAIKPDGTATLSVLMPFWNMADEDLVAIVSYLRSMQPVQHEVQPPQYTLMGKVIRTLAPTFKPILDPVAPKTAPPMAATIERGKYLAHYVANCVGCHTERDQATFDAIDAEFAGGMEFEPFSDLYKELNVDPDLWMRSPNITRAANSALANYPTKEEWIARFRKGRIISYSPMDWGPFSRMTDEDLEAIWLYLQSLEPVEKEIGPLVFKK